jgi:hypothetical protein
MPDYFLIAPPVDIYYIIIQTLQTAACTAAYARLCTGYQ